MTQKRETPRQAFEIRIRRVAMAFNSWRITEGHSYRRISADFYAAGYKRGTCTTSLLNFSQNALTVGYSHQRVPACIEAIGAIEDSSEINAVGKDIDDLMNFEERFIRRNISIRKRRDG